MCAIRSQAVGYLSKISFLTTTSWLTLLLLKRYCQVPQRTNSGIGRLKVEGCRKGYTDDGLILWCNEKPQEFLHRRVHFKTSILLRPVDELNLWRPKVWSGKCIAKLITAMAKTDKPIKKLAISNNLLCIDRISYLLAALAVAKIV